MKQDYPAPHSLCLHHGLALLCLATLILSCGCSSGNKKERHLKRADDYFAAAQFEEATIEYLNVLRYEPDQPHAIRQLGMTYWAAQDYRRAMPCLLASLQQDPQDIEVRIKIGTIYLMARQFERGHEEAQAILQIDSDNIDAILLLTDTARASDEQTEAFKRVERALATHKDKSELLLAKANLLKRLGRPAEAETAYLAAMALDPEKPELVMAQAEFLMQQNRLEEAEAAFERAITLAPNNPAFRSMQAMFYLRTNRRERAEHILRDLTIQFPSYQSAAFQLAQLYIDSHQTENARAVLDTIEKASPESIQLGLLRAALYMDEEDRASAREELQKLAHTYPGAPVIKVRLAELLIDDSEFDKAVQHLQQVLALDPALHPAKMLLAKAQFSLGQNQEAITLLEDSREEGRVSIESTHLLAQLYAASDNPGKALELTQELIKVAPENPNHHALQGDLLLAQRKTKEAEKAFRRAIRLEPGHAASIKQLMGIELNRNQGAAALELADQALEQLPSSGQLLYLKAIGQLANGDLSAGEQTLEAAIEADPEQIEPYYALCGLFAQTGRTPEAQERIAQALEKDPDHVQSLMLSALLLDRQQELEGARNTYEKILAVQPTFVPALNNLAYLYSTRFENMDRALALAQQARDRVPKNPYIADTLGWILWQRNEVGYALPLLEQAAAALAEQPEVMYHVGMARLSAGQEDAATQALQFAASHASEFSGKTAATAAVKALAIAPTSATADKALAALKSIQDEQGSNPAIQLRLSQALRATGDTDAAIETLTTLLEDRPACAPALQELAWNLLEGRDDRDQALAVAQRARDLASGQAHYVDTLAWMALQAGNLEWALSLSQEAVEKLPDSSAAKYHWAAALLISGDTKAAKDLLQQIGDPPYRDQAKQKLVMLAAAHNPKTLSEEQAERLANEKNKADHPLLTTFALARYFDDRQDTSRAQVLYEEIYTAYPTFLPALLWLAERYMTDASRLDEANKLARAARQRLPDDPLAASVLGRISVLRETFDYAKPLLQQALAAYPNDEVIRMSLATACLNLGDTADAVSHLKHLAQTSTDMARKDAALSLLASLKETAP